MKPITNHQYIPFGPYLTKMDIDLEFCSHLLRVGKTLTEKYNSFLAGNIKDEYLYDLKKHLWIEEEFKTCINAWITGFKQFSGDATFNPKFKIDSLWINFQKAGEYNPIHLHPNSNLSFVLYLEVPEEMLKEKQITKGIPPGHTGFIYGEYTDVFCVVADRCVIPKVGTLLMFPSVLRHYASHFNSKVTRTSVSGNVTFTYMPPEAANH